MPGKERMSRKFIKVTSGWIPVSVLLLCTVALVTGGQGADVQAEAAVLETPSVDLHTRIQSTLKDMESVRQLAGPLGHLPYRVELIIDASISSAQKAPGGSKLLQGFEHE